MKEKYGFKQKHAMKYSTQKPIQKNFDWVKAVIESAAFAFAENTRRMRLKSILIGLNYAVDSGTQPLLT